MSRPQCITTFQAYEELLMENLLVSLAIPFAIVVFAYIAYRTMK